MKRTLVLVVLTLLAAALFVEGAMVQGVFVNTNYGRRDQSAYMHYAERLSATHYADVGDRNRMPVYPALMSLVYRPGMSTADFFRVGKQASIALAVLVLVGAFFILKRYASTLDAATATLVAAFTVFAFKAPYFQADVLYYGLTFLLFFLLLSLLRRPRLLTSAVAGGVAGLAWLTKASLLPTVVLAVCFLTLRAAIALWRQRHAGAQGETASPWRTVRQHLLCIGLFLLCFLLVVFPYIRTSKARFGQYFYNVNTTFYVWNDSWREAVLGTKAHGDRVGWPTMPPDRIPSFSRYIQHHSTEAVLSRFLTGLKTLGAGVLESYGYAEFVFAYIGALAVLFVQNKGLSHLRRLWREAPSVLLFIGAYFGTYIGAYAWYMAIAPENRFVLALFLPTLLLFSAGLTYAQENGMTIKFLGRKLDAGAISLAILLFLGAYLAASYPFRISTMWGGS